VVIITRRTREALGFPITPHRFRHAAATFWSVHDAKNVRGAKDLLGHSSFGTTENHYNISQSRLAGRKFAMIVDNAAKR
jgi:integrase